MLLVDFIELLNNNLEKELVFEYAPNLFVGKNYHLTEIKKQNIHSVDCGGNQHVWKKLFFSYGRVQMKKQPFLYANKQGIGYRLKSSPCFCFRFRSGSKNRIR